MIIITILKGKMMTAKRFILNETSYHGQGAAAAIIDEIKSRGFNKALIVTDADLIKFGVVKKITDLLEAEGFAYAVFDGVKANPSVGVVKAGVKAFKAAGADYMIAVGGGSPQDTAKGIGIIINNPEFADVVSLEGTAPTRHKSVPVIAVATTAGTAAETTINYVITDEEKRRKFVCVDPHDIPVVAIVDPDMMASMPKGLTAATGMDALTHAIEGYTTLAAWELSDTLNLKAIENRSKAMPKDAKTWLSANMSPGWPFPTSDSASCTAWPIRFPPSTTRRTAWPTPSCCLTLWNSTLPIPAKNSAKSPAQWGLKAWMK